MATAKVKPVDVFRFFGKTIAEYTELNTIRLSRYAFPPEATSVVVDAIMTMIARQRPELVQSIAIQIKLSADFWLRNAGTPDQLSPYFKKLNEIRETGAPAAELDETEPGNALIA